MNSKVKNPRKTSASRRRALLADCRIMSLLAIQARSANINALENGRAALSEAFSTLKANEINSLWSFMALWQDMPLPVKSSDVKYKSRREILHDHYLHLFHGMLYASQEHRQKLQNWHL